jgi:hypothetical protein
MGGSMMGNSSSGVTVARQSDVAFVHTTACSMDWWIFIHI